ncbi:MAG TPA: DUF1801 domain-containing protein [Actinomycetota bacterium]
MTAPDVERYLATLPAEQASALRDLRATILAVVPGATEGVSYGVPTVKLRGHPLVGFGAAKAHCSLFLMSTEAMDAHAGLLAGYDTGKGTVRFDPSAPLPADLVERLVRTRVADVDGRWPA